MSESYSECGADADAEETAVEGSLPAGHSPARTTEEVSISYEREPPRGEAGRLIHERMPAPTVPEGEDVPDRTPSPPVRI